MTDHDIDKLYKQQAIEQPPIAVDNLITQLAQQSIGQKKVIKSASFSRKYIPFSLVASVMLVGILVLNFPQHYTNTPTEIPINAPTKQLSSSPIKETSQSLDEQKEPSISADFNQESLNLQPPSSIINNDKMINKRQQFAQKEQSQRQKSSNNKQIKHRLLKDIAQQTILNNTIEATELAQQYVKQFGLDQLPQKYHYLLIKKLK